MVVAARPGKLVHSLTAIAPTAVPALAQLFVPLMLPGILLIRIWKSDVGVGSGAGSGDPSGLGLLFPSLGGADEAAAAVLAGNGLRCATAATPRYPATSAIAATIPIVLRLSIPDLDDRRRGGRPPASPGIPGPPGKPGPPGEPVPAVGPAGPGGGTVP